MCSSRLKFEQAKLTRSQHSNPTSTDGSDADSHKNEGFLKSMWHTLTNHPAHQKDGEAAGETKSDNKDTKDTKSDEKPDDQKKA